MDYEYINNHYKLIIDLSRQKELDAYPKAIQQIEVVVKLNNPADTIVSAELCLF